MKKILIYVDAENVSYEECVTQVESVRASYGVANCIIGKVYGNHEILSPELLHWCLGVGFDYIDTSVIVLNRKNVADMKIVVDCVFDACNYFYGEVSKVFIISKDCDFVPVVQKLNSIGVCTEVPLYVQPPVSVAKSLEDSLLEKGWDPSVSLDALIAPFDAVEGFLGVEREQEISNYFRKKKRRISNEISARYGTSFGSRIVDVPEHSFSLVSVFKAVGCQKFDTSEDAIFLINLYTSKMFGFVYSKNVVVNKLREFYSTI